MYVYRTLEQLNSVPIRNWTLEELAYHHDTMNRFRNYLNEDGQGILEMVDAEIDARGGLPIDDGAYDHTSTLHYE